MSLRVVIAEDEAIIRMDLRETLEEEGYDVVGETGRGDEAVRLVRELEPDLAVLDVKMPGMDGLEAAGIITAEKLCGVLILTAFSQREIVEQVLVPVDGREALRTHVVAKLDGVPRELLLHVVKKNGCVYDFALVAPPGERFAQSRASYETVLQSFETR